MSDVTQLTRIQFDSDGEPYVMLNPSLLSQMGWDAQTLLEWESLGTLVIIRGKQDGNSSVS